MYEAKDFNPRCIENCPQLTQNITELEEAETTRTALYQQLSAEDPLSSLPDTAPFRAAVIEGISILMHKGKLTKDNANERIAKINEASDSEVHAVAKEITDDIYSHIRLETTELVFDELKNGNLSQEKADEILAGLDQEEIDLQAANERIEREAEEEQAEDDRQADEIIAEIKNTDDRIYALKVKLVICASCRGPKAVRNWLGIRTAYSCSADLEF